MSILRLIECLGDDASSQCSVVLVSALTNAAIEAVLSKLRALMDHQRAIPDLDHAWIDRIDAVHVTDGDKADAPTTGRITIYFGTAFQLFKLGKKRKLVADLIVLDEAGQLALGTAALVLRALRPGGKLVVAGDTLQLAPIFVNEYPAGEIVFGSVLDLVMHATDAFDRADEDAMTDSQSLSIGSDSLRPSTVVQLVENHRLNSDLGELIQLACASRRSAVLADTPQTRANSSRRRARRRR